MTILVAVPDSKEGAVALAAAADEAELLGTDLVVVNLGLNPLDTSSLPPTLKVTVTKRTGKSDRDPVDAVLADIEEYGATRLVIGVRRRSPVGKALLGSVSQGLLLEAPVPVLAIKIDEPRR
ncbi:universal stress protein [Terrabacter sp. GCM10028922]|jgi:nucleotide-binding universal stress UspA family protein|uniref:universal stress protein n=1 Tax=Terrabacter sp. GCM10028922 TaxID=3273428 RepID=UPI00361C83BA